MRHMQQIYFFSRKEQCDITKIATDMKDVWKHFLKFWISHISALDSISDHYFENEAMIAWWNDWKARDQRAKIEKTFNHGRFSREKRTLGLSLLINRWYLCFILSVAIVLVNELSASPSLISLLDLCLSVFFSPRSQLYHWYPGTDQKCELGLVKKNNQN